MKVINEPTWTAWLDAQQGVARMADFGWRPAVSNLSHSSVSSQSLLDCCPVMALAQYYTQRYKEMSVGKFS